MARHDKRAGLSFSLWKETVLTKWKVGWPAATMKFGSRERLYLMEWTSDRFSHGELGQLQVDIREQDDV